MRRYWPYDIRLAISPWATRSSSWRCSDGQSLSSSWHFPDETVETQNRPESILEPLTTPARRKNVSKKKGTGKLGNRRETLHAERVCKKSHSRKPLRTVIQQEADIRSRQLYHETASSSRISTDDCQPCERFIYDLSEADNNAPGCSSRPLHWVRFSSFEVIKFY